LKTLNQLKAGNGGIIKKINADSELSLRLISFGIHKGAHFGVKNISLRKKTMEIEVGNTLVALRFDEAKHISVEENQ
jgi:ferrous iron transport protein A